MLKLSAVLPALAVLVSSAALAHDSAPKLMPAPAAAKAKAELKPGEVMARGEKLKGLPAVTLADLLATPEKYQDKSIRVEGTIRRACQKAGCWMELAESTDKAANGMRVLMKDHAFFVPTDSAGSKATVEGKVAVKMLDQEEADHMKSEGGTVPTDKNGKPREVQLEAVGVELVRS